VASPQVSQWIHPFGKASLDNIIPRRSEQTSIWSLITREFGELSREGKQMTAGIVLTGAPFCARAQDGSKRVA